MTDAIITVRAKSSRLPNKCFLNIANRSVLKHVIERCQKNDLDPVVATTVEDDAIIGLCKRLGVRCFAGSVEDKLERWLNACKQFQIASFVTVDCDDPLFDASLSLAQHEMLFRSFSTDVVSPDMKAFLGSNGWAFKTATLERICERKISTATEMIWKHIPSYISIEQFDAKPVPEEENLRLTLDYIEDYWLITTVVRELGYACTREQIVEFFTKNPGLRILNEFRNIDWKNRQG